MSFRSLAGLASALLIWGMAPSAASAQTVAVDEALVRAALLVNFAKFVRWPAIDAAGNAGRFAVCVHEDTATLAALGTKAGTKVQGRLLQARGADGLESVHLCEVLFVGRSASADARLLASAVGGLAILVVSERAEDENLATIRLASVDSRVAFDVNLAAAKRAGLEVDSQLLGIARHVTQTGAKAQ